MTTPQPASRPNVFTPDECTPPPDPLAPGVIVSDENDPPTDPDEERPRPDEDEGTFGN